MAREAASPAQIRLVTALVILGVFVTGAAAGFGLARWVAPSHEDRRPPPPLGRLLDKLSLTPEQRTAAEAISERFEREVDAVMQEAFPKVRNLREAAAKELRALLTPEQAARFDALEAERPPEGRPGHHHGPGGRGDRPPKHHRPHDGPMDERRGEPGARGPSSAGGPQGCGDERREGCPDDGPGGPPDDGRGDRPDDGPGGPPAANEGPEAPPEAAPPPAPEAAPPATPAP